MKRTGSKTMAAAAGAEKCGYLGFIDAHYYRVGKSMGNSYFSEDVGYNIPVGVVVMVYSHGLGLVWVRPPYSAASNAQIESRASTSFRTLNNINTNYILLLNPRNSFKAENAVA